MKILHASIILLFTISFITCTPKVDSSVGSATFEEKDIDVNKTTKIGSVKSSGGASISYSKGGLKQLFENRFKRATKISDFEVLQFASNGPFYLTAKGEEGGDKIIMAIELEQKGEELHDSEYNKLYTSCIAKFCDICAFTVDDSGSIDNCKCQEGEIESEYSACEHHTYIKTLEEDF